MSPKITHITEKDIEILAQKLGKNQKEKIALIHLLKQEPEKIDQILDFESIKRYILEAPSPIPISAQLYFHYLGKLALGKRGLKNQELISYITKLLMRFLKMDSFVPFSRLGSRRNFLRMSDLLLSLEKTADSMQAYQLHHFIADYSLFVCGLFKENIERCWNGSPGMEFYEGLGMRSYALAASYPEAQKNSLQGIFSFLSSAFKEVRFALNEIQEQFFHFSDISP